MKIQGRRSGRPLSPEMLADPRLGALATWGAKLAASGLSPERSGNLSCRTTKGFLITATGVPLGSIRPEDWVEVITIEHPDEETIVVESNGTLEPSRDAAVHGALYAGRPDADTIFHLHVGSLEELRDQLDVPSTEHYFPAGTTESVAEIHRFLDAHPDVRYFILVDHGIVAWGTAVNDVGAEVTEKQRALEEA